jgi:hypothetical protein
LPGAAWIPWAVAGLALGITLLRIPDAADERLDREFSERLRILRLHSGSLRAGPPRPMPVPETAVKPAGR